MKKLNINIDGRELEAYAGQTILEAAQAGGIFIPTFCADGRTEIFGACGICLVEAEGNPKLLKACATEAADGMVIRTDTPRLVQSRKTLLELLLSDHTGDCLAPCLRGCPANTDCQGYVGLAANGRAEEAYKLIMRNIPLPASIGRVCPHPCETECRRGLVEEPIGIARIKRFCGDFALESDIGGDWIPAVPEETGKKVAVIGAGPYGLSLAYFLRLLGHSVLIYEAMPQAGGMLRYGIPEYRLPKAVLDKEISRLESMGIEIRTGMRVGRDISFESIQNSFDAVCVGVGAWVSTGTGAKGEDLPGVIGGIELLSRVTCGEGVYIGKRVAVVGGGNTAMDACRTAVRMGAQKVYSVYRRTKNEMPAEQIEVAEAVEEGVVFKELTNPEEIIAGADGRVSKIKLQVMRLGEPDESGRRAPLPVPGKFETLEVDTVVLAIGQAPDPASLGAPGLKLTRKNGVVYDPKTFATSVPGVFAGGDCGNDKVSIAVEAIGDAEHSAGVIDAYLSGESVAFEPEYCSIRHDVDERSFEGRERLFRPPSTIMEPEERARCFAEIDAGWDAVSASQEGLRCLECGCGDFHECKLIEYARLYGVEPERYSGDLSAAGPDGAMPPPDADKDGHPYIEREGGKCILCGLCVRVCEEVAGVAALGFSGRGFDTVVNPAFGAPLAGSACISCGLCVDACPTGALRERLQLRKAVTLETEITETVCPHCGVGCRIGLESYGDMLVKANPHICGDAGGIKGLICGRGKFGFDCSEIDQGEVWDDNARASDADRDCDMARAGDAARAKAAARDGFGGRLLAPRIRDAAGLFAEAPWYDAFVAVAKRALSVRAKYGPGSVAVSISDRMTNEEIFAARSLALALEARVFSFNNRASAAASVFGAPASHEFAELLHTGYILTVGLDLRKNPVLAMRLRQAAAAGVKIVKIEADADPFPTRFDAEAVRCANSLKLLSGIEAALMREIAPGAAMKSEKIPEAAVNIAKELMAAKKAMIVYQRNVLTNEAAALLCRIALLSGHEGAPRDGVFEILPKCNSRGLYDLEIRATPDDILYSGHGADVKAMLVFGEDPAGQIAAAEAKGRLPAELKAAKKLLSQAEFLAVCDTHMTATAQRADVVVPATGFASAQGTFTNTEGRLGAVTRAVRPAVPYYNWQICSEIAGIAGAGASWENEADISREMRESVPAYRQTEINRTLAGQGAPAPGFDSDAVLAEEPERNGKLTDPLPTSDNLTRYINGRLGVAYGD